jgi:hypothetical protein
MDQYCHYYLTTDFEKLMFKEIFYAGKYEKK